MLLVRLLEESAVGRVILILEDGAFIHGYYIYVGDLVACEELKKSELESKLLGQKTSIRPKSIFSRRQ